MAARTALRAGNKSASFDRRQRRIRRSRKFRPHRDFPLCIRGICRLFSKTLARCLVLTCALSIFCAGVAFAAPQQGAGEKAPAASKAKAPAHKSGAAVKKPAKRAPKAAKPATRHPAKAPEGVNQNNPTLTSRPRPSGKEGRGLVFSPASGVRRTVRHHHVCG